MIGCCLLVGQSVHSRAGKKWSSRGLAESYAAQHCPLGKTKIERESYCFVRSVSGERANKSLELCKRIFGFMSLFMQEVRRDSKKRNMGFVEGT